MDKSNLPVKADEKRIIKNVKTIGKKSAKVLVSGVATLGFSTAFIISTATVPVLALPTIVGVAISTQKLLNNTKYKSYKDLAFITGKHKRNVKIYQDVTRADLYVKMKGMSNIEKVAFMQLQAIIGLSKFKPLDRKGKEVTFETDSHGVNRKTFRKLQELGYIKDYNETFKKKSKLILPKLAFGNIKDLNKKTDIYNIKFKLSGKPLELEDENLKRYFPMVLGDKNGIVAKKGYNFKREDDGSLTIEYNPKEPFMERKKFPIRKSKDFKEELREGVYLKENEREFIRESNNTVSNIKNNSKEDDEKTK